MEKNSLGFLVEPLNFKDLPRSQETILLQDLLNKKTEYTDAIQKMVRSLSSFKERFTKEEYEKKLLELKITQWNLVSIKDCITIANMPLFSVIYAKAEAEQYRVSLNSLVTKHKKDANIRNIFENKLKDVREELLQYKKRIDSHNITTAVKVELILIS